VISNPSSGLRTSSNILIEHHHGTFESKGGAKGKKKLMNAATVQHHTSERLKEKAAASSLQKHTFKYQRLRIFQSKLRIMHGRNWKQMKKLLRS